MIIGRARLGLALFLSLLLASTFACVRPKPENQVMKLGDDVLASGSTPFIRDSVVGDAIMAGGDVTFSGTAGGDYVGAGGKQEVSGRVHGSLRAAGGHVVVKATVDRNATIGGGDLAVDSSAVIAHNVYLIGGTIRMEGTVRGGLLATGGNIVINGPITGDVEIAAGSLRLGPRAQIGGSLTYRVSKEDVRIDPAAHVAGKITALPVQQGNGAWRWLWIFGGLLAGAVVVLLLPRFVAEAAEVFGGRPLRAALVGFVCAIVFPIAIIIAAVTVIGLPLALLMAAVLAIFAGLSQVPTAVWVGERILHNRTPLGRQSAIVNFFLGSLVLIVVGIIPFIGPLALLISSCLGFGSILVAAWTARERQLA
jgi:hypothetical protein